MSLLKAKTTRSYNKAKEEALEAVKAEQTIRLNINVPQSLHRKFKLCAVEEDKDMTQILLKLIEKYIQKKQKARNNNG